MMNSNIRIAKQLVRIARMLVAFNRNELENQLKKKRSDLDEKSFKEHLDCLDDMDAKEQKVALYWINKKRLILPEDLSKFNEAMNLIDKQHLDFQKFEGPMEVVNRNDKSTLRIKSQDSHFNPSTEKAFSHPYNAGDGVVIYNVENSKEGQLAVRKAIDVNWGYDKNPWCLAARKDGFDQNEIDSLSREQAEELGLYSDDALATAWKHWNHYKAYPKRIAFKSGKLLAFSAGDKKQHVEWWDKDDKPHYAIPESNAVDDIEFLKKHGKLNLLDSDNVSVDTLKELAEDKNVDVREKVAENPKTPDDILGKLAEDENVNVRYGVAKNPKTPVDIIRKLAENKDWSVRNGVVKNPNTPVDIIRKLAEDEELVVRIEVAWNHGTPAEILGKLAEDKNGDVRKGVATNPSTPVDTLGKLAEDKSWEVRNEVAKNPRTPVDILKKLVEDKNVNVRYGVAKNPSTPVDIIRKLVEDEDRRVRIGIAYNPSTPADILRKLAEDENWNVRYGVAYNPSTPADILRKLAENEDWSVRDGVAKNPNTPVDTLRKLAEDENEYARENANYRLRQLGQLDNKRG